MKTNTRKTSVTQQTDKEKKMACIAGVLLLTLIVIVGVVFNYVEQFI